MRGKLLVALGGSLLMGITGVAHADAPDSLRAEMATLKSRLAELESRQSSNWLNERRSEEIKSLIHDVLSDADTRASLLAEGATAGHNGDQFYLASDDGSFLLQVRGYVQFRYTYRMQDDNTDAASIAGGGGLADGQGLRVAPAIGDENDAGFTLPRTKLIFSGHVADPRVSYLISLNVDDVTNNVDADEITLTYQLTDTTSIWAGEKKAPFLREEMAEPTDVLGVDRSYVNEFFTIGIVQGFGIVWEADDDLTISVAISDGQNSGDVGGGPANLFTQALGSQGEANAAGAFAAANCPAGDCTQASSKDFDADRSDFALTARADMTFPGLDLGVAIHWETGETGDAGKNNDFVSWTIDGSFETNGLDVYAAVVGLHPSLGNENDTFAEDYDLYGLILQASGTLPNSDWEPFVRWEYIDLDDSINDGANEYDDVHLLTVGVNRYYNGNAAKFTLDVVFALDAVPVASQGLGINADNPNIDDQTVIRAQYTVMF